MQPLVKVLTTIRNWQSPLPLQNQTNEQSDCTRTSGMTFFIQTINTILSFYYQPPSSISRVLYPWKVFVLTKASIISSKSRTGVLREMSTNELPRLSHPEGKRR